MIDSINLSTEYEHLIAQPWINGGMRVKIEQIKALLTNCRSPRRYRSRARRSWPELFTHKGSGTLVRRGERVQRFASWDGVDRARLTALIESSLAVGWCRTDFEDSARAYISENYRTAVILTDGPRAPTSTSSPCWKKAQGGGLGPRHCGRSCARRRRHCSGVRATAIRSILLYAPESGRLHQAGEWKVFWYGLDGFDAIARCVAHCRARPATLDG